MRSIINMVAVVLFFSAAPGVIGSECPGRVGASILLEPGSGLAGKGSAVAAEVRTNGAFPYRGRSVCSGLSVLPRARTSGR